MKPPLLDRLHDDCAGAVSEEDERRAVLPVEDLREHVSSDHERASRETRREHPVGLRDRVDESRAAREQVVGRRLRHPERIREDGRGGREHHVRRHRRADEEIDVRGIDAGVLESRRAAGIAMSVSASSCGGDPPLADAGPLANPLVGGVHDLGELVVRHHLRGDMYAEAGDPDPDALRGAEHR